MKKEIRAFCSFALIAVLAGSSLLALGQQRQPAPERTTVERQKSEQGATSSGSQSQEGATHDRIMIEHEASAQGQHGGSGGDYIFLATEMSFGGKLVKGAPYSGQAVTESIQTLSDGNRIINRTTAAVYRDGEGRTRREQSLKAIGPYASGGEPPVTVFINDPVAGTSFTLDPRAQTVRKMSPMRFKVSSQSVTNDAKAAEKTPDARYREGVAQVTLERSAAAASGGYRVSVEPGDGQEKRRVEAGVAMGMTSTRNRTARTDQLGTQNIGGVEAEGTRTTVTIQAGEIGNERPIEIVSERWYSPELQVIVMTRHTDPRFGENTYQLTNIIRSEPAHELFEVPAGFRVIDSGAGAGRGTGAGTGSGFGTGAGTSVGTGINGGVLNGKAITLPLPEYPEIARAAKAAGTVTVQVTVDEDGNVVSADAVAGHPLLRAAAVTAAKQAKFSPTKLSGQGVKVNGTVVYNFVAQ